MMLQAKNETKNKSTEAVRSLWPSLRRLSQVSSASLRWFVASVRVLPQANPTTEAAETDLSTTFSTAPHELLSSEELINPYFAFNFLRTYPWNQEPSTWRSFGNGCKQHIQSDPCTQKLCPSMLSVLQRSSFLIFLLQLCYLCSLRFLLCGCLPATQQQQQQSKAEETLQKSEKFGK